MNFKPGDLITFVDRELRTGAADVMYRTIARVTEVVELRNELQKFLILRQVCIFCWVEGYHELGRFLPTRGEDGQYENVCSLLFYDARL